MKYPIRIEEDNTMNSAEERNYIKVISVSNNDKRTPTGATAKVTVDTAKKLFTTDLVKEGIESGTIYLKEDTYKSVETSLIPAKTGINYVYHKDRELLTVYSNYGVVEFCDDHGINIKDFNTLVEIAPTVKSCERMFSGCESFNKQVYIPESVENCRLMFNDCHSLNSAVIVGNSVTNCSSMFWGCTAFNKEVIIPKSAENCDSMFYACKSLNQSIKIPDSVKSSHNMFEGCPIIPTLPENKYTLDTLQHDPSTLIQVMEKHWNYANWFNETFPNGASSKEEVLERL